MADDTEEPNSYRAFLRGALRARGIPQRELAARMGRSPSYVSQMLNGRRSLRPRDAAAVGDILTLGERDRSLFLALVEIEEGESPLAANVHRRS